MSSNLKVGGIARAPVWGANPFLTNHRRGRNYYFELFNMSNQSSWIMPRPFSGKENEDFEAFLLDFDNACDANGWDDTTILARPVRPAPIRTRGEASGSHYTVTPSPVTSTPAPPKETTFYTRYSEACSDGPYAPDDIPTPKIHYADDTKSKSSASSSKPDASLPTKDYQCPGPLGRGSDVGTPVAPNPFLTALEAKDEDAARKLHCKLVLLTRSLRDSAARFLLSLTVVECGQYDTLRKILTERYMPAEAQYVRRTRLRTKRRQHGESLSTLADDIRLLTARAYPRAGVLERDDYAMESFIQALGESLRARVRDSQPETMQDALRRALYLEAHSFADASARHERNHGNDPYSAAVSSVRDERPPGSGSKGNSSNSRAQQYTNEPDTLTRLCLAVEKLETRLSVPVSTFNGDPHKGRKPQYDSSHNEPTSNSARSYGTGPYRGSVQGPPSFESGYQTSHHDNYARHYDPPRGSVQGPPSFESGYQPPYHDNYARRYDPPRGSVPGPPSFESGYHDHPMPHGSPRNFDHDASYAARPDQGMAYGPRPPRTKQGSGYGPPRHGPRPHNSRVEFRYTRTGSRPPGPSSHPTRFHNSHLN